MRSVAPHTNDPQRLRLRSSPYKYFKIMQPIVYSKEFETELLDNATIVFDTSSIGLLYEMTEKYKKQLISIIEHLKSRIWLPAQVYTEYMRHKDKFLSQAIREDYSQPTVFKNNIIAEIKKIIERHKDKQYFHPYLDDNVIEDLRDNFKTLEESYEFIKHTINSQYGKRKAEIKSLIEKSDSDVIFKIFSEVEVGSPFGFADILSIAKEGELRYRYSIPPGYMDVKAKIDDGVRVFGDLIVWKEILRYAKSNKKSVLLVCDDVKEDWYTKDIGVKSNKSEELRPREELLSEFIEETGQKCWIVPLSRFIKLLESNLNDKSILQLFEGLDQVLFVLEQKELDKRRKSLNLEYLRIRCARCHHSFDVNLPDLSQVWKITSVDERPMGDETEYTSSSSVECPHCTNLVELNAQIWEYPDGVFYDHSLDCCGGEVLRDRVVWRNRLGLLKEDDNVCVKCGKHGPVEADGLCKECYDQYAYGVE